MKRILHIVGTMDRAGAETMIMNLYRVIDKTQIQFDFLYFTPKRCDFDDEIEELGGRIYRIIENNAVRRMLATTKLLRGNSQWNTVHAHNLFSNAFHLLAAYKAGIKQRISHSHTINTQFRNKLVGLFYPYLSRKIQQKYATHFVACSAEAGCYLFPDQKNVRILNNSIDVEHFAQIREKHKNYLREKFNLDHDVLVILQLGRLILPKNHQFSLQIAHELKRKGIKFKMFFGGKGDLFNMLTQEVKTLNLEKEVVFLGLRKDVPKLLAGSDLMLMPSLYEGLGVVLIEAQAAGIPSLISDTIPSDADVGIGLINANSLKEPTEIWAKHLIKICKKKITVKQKERLSELRKQGYDVSTNVQLLVQLYNSMK